jgi:branched-chain amino acid transport system substrate-binding protein
VLSEGADFVVATCDYDTAAPAARVAQTKKIITIAFCASAPEWNQIGPYAYSMSMGSITEAAVNGQFATKKGCTKGYLLTDTSSSYTQQIANNVPKYFEGEIVGKDTFKNDDSSFASQVSRLQSASPKPECIFLSTFPPGGVTVVRALRAAGIDQMIMAPDGMDGDFWISAVPDLSDFYFSAYGSIFGDDPNPEVNELVAEIAKREKVERISGSTAITGAAILDALKIAIEAAGSTDSDAVRAELDKFTDQDLLVGPTTFTPTSHLSLGRPMAVIGVDNGKFSFQETFTPEGLEPTS